MSVTFTEYFCYTCQVCRERERERAEECYEQNIISLQKMDESRSSIIISKQQDVESAKEPKCNPNTRQIVAKRDSCASQSFIISVPSRFVITFLFIFVYSF